MEGIQQLAWIQSLPSNTVYELLLLTMKNEVGIVLWPTVNSTLRTPITSDGCPLKSLSVMLVLMRSAEERPNRRSTEYGINCSTGVNQHPVNGFTVDEALEIQPLQMFVASFLWLLKDDRLGAKIQLCNRQI